MHYFLSPQLQGGGRRIATVCFPVYLLLCIPLAQADTERSSFVTWARETSIQLPGSGKEISSAQLAILGKMIGNASVVAIGEGVHFGLEPLEFRNRLIEYLVREKGFTTVAIESGLVESRAAHDYVRNGAGDLSSVLPASMTWGFGLAPQNRALLSTLRARNADPLRSRKINFYGFDMSGSPGNSAARYGLDMPLRRVLEYLSQVDKAAAGAFDRRLDAFLPKIKFDLFRRVEGPGYDKLSPIERDTLTGTLNDLTALLEKREARYIAASSTDEYQWAYRTALSARQVDTWLRHVPRNWEASAEQIRVLDEMADSRDRSQADNLEWIIQREGSSAKTVVFAHNGHLSNAPIEWGWWPLDRKDGERQEPVGVQRHEVMGTYLRRRFGAQLITIGNLVSGGEIGCMDYKEALQPASHDSLAGLAREVGSRPYVLDLRGAPKPIAKWLNEPRSMGVRFDLPAWYSISSELAPRDAFDAVVYFGDVTPAC